MQLSPPLFFAAGQSYPPARRGNKSAPPFYVRCARIIPSSYAVREAGLSLYRNITLSETAVIVSPSCRTIVSPCLYSRTNPATRSLKVGRFSAADSAV